MDIIFFHAEYTVSTLRGLFLITFFEKMHHKWKIKENTQVTRVNANLFNMGTMFKLEYYLITHRCCFHTEFFKVYCKNIVNTIVLLQLICVTVLPANF